MKDRAALERPVARSGIVGLDEILGGGFPRRQLYLVEGGTGAGKTTLGLKFLLTGAAQGERALYLGFSETPEDVQLIADSHGWSLEGVTVRKVVSESDGAKQAQYTLFPASEVELHELTENVTACIMEESPDRLLIDPVSALRWFAADAFEYRRHIENLARALHAYDCTTLLIDDATPAEHQFHPRGLAHGVLILSDAHQPHGRCRRRLRVEKLRGRPVLGGYHDYDVVTGGVEVYPRIEVSPKARTRFSGPPLLAGRGDFAALLGGGLPWGSSVLITGQAGAGKSSIAMSWAAEAAAEGGRVLYLSFDEAVDSIERRSAALGVDVQGLRASGRLVLERVDPASSSPGQMAQRVRRSVEQNGQRMAMVVIDSLSGCLHATGSSRYSDLQLHQLLDYLRSFGVITVLLHAHGPLSDGEATADLSCISDVTVLTTFFEAKDALHRAVSVIKHREHRHEHTIRELVLEPGGLRLGEPLSGFRGLLTGIPRYDI